jgi:hypothetical protein
MASDCIVRPLQTRGCFGFGHRTAYLAIAYFDSFLLRRRVDVIYPRRRLKKTFVFSKKIKPLLLGTNARMNA